MKSTWPLKGSFFSKGAEGGGIAPLTLWIGYWHGEVTMAKIMLFRYFIFRDVMMCVPCSSIPFRFTKDSYNKQKRKDVSKVTLISKEPWFYSCQRMKTAEMIWIHAIEALLTRWGWRHLARFRFHISCCREVIGEHCATDAKPAGGQGAVVPLDEGRTG